MTKITSLFAFLIMSMSSSVTFAIGASCNTGTYGGMTQTHQTSIDMTTAEQSDWNFIDAITRVTITSPSFLYGEEIEDGDPSDYPLSFGWHIITEVDSVGYMSNDVEIFGDPPLYDSAGSTCPSDDIIP